MSSIVFLIPLGLALGLAALAAFLWSLGSGQYEDMDGAAARVILDAPDRPGSDPHVSAFRPKS